MDKENKSKLAEDIRKLPPEQRKMMLLYIEALASRVLKK